MSVKLDETGLHASDCACARCEAGFRPSMRQRWQARRALDNVRRRAQLAAAKAAHPTEMPAVAARIAAGRLVIAAEVEETARRLEELRAAEREQDPRTAVFRALRAKGATREEAFAEVERQFGPDTTNQGENDDAERE